MSFVSYTDPKAVKRMFTIRSHEHCRYRENKIDDVSRLLAKFFHPDFTRDCFTYTCDEGHRCRGKDESH